MRGKFICKQVLLACITNKKKKFDIHDQLEQTIAERKKIIQEWETKLYQRTAVIKTIKKDIHAELAETIAAYERTMEEWRKKLDAKQHKLVSMGNKQAA